MIAVRAWRPATPMSSGARPPLHTYDADAAYAAEQEHLVADVAQVLGPDHGVVCRLVHGGRRKVLLAQAEGDLLVIDAPRQPDLAGGPLFAHRLIHRAPCPVVVMPSSVSGMGPSALARAGRTTGKEVIRADGSAGRPGVRGPSARPDEHGNSGA